MASTFHNRSLAFLMAVAKTLFNFDAPLGYQHDTGFHIGRILARIDAPTAGLAARPKDAL
jgi:hypothetical protein